MKYSAQWYVPAWCPKVPPGCNLSICAELGEDGFPDIIWFETSELKDQGASLPKYVRQGKPKEWTVEVHMKEEIPAIVREKTK